MILEKTEIVQRENLVGESDGFDMSLSADDMSWIMTLLSDLYKDPYSIVIQEWLSNSWDSHLEADCPEDPIVLEIKTDVNDKWYLACHDFGVGISPDRIKIFGAYGKSTKRTDANAIGCFGVGSKSVMCYTQSFFVETVFDGIKYIYSISPNEEGIPRIELLGEEESDLSNRSKLWFYLKKDEKYYSYYSNKKSESEKFVEGAIRKTSYFNNLVYDFDPSLKDLNKYKRIEGKHFVYSEAEPFNSLHILIGQVPYELDFGLLGISPINIPIAVKVPQGVMPVPTRESIKYSTKAIDLIKGAIQEAATELVEMCNQKRINVTNWREWLNIKNHSPRVEIEGNTLFISDLVQYSNVELKNVVFTPLKDVDTSNLNRDNLFPISFNVKINKGKKQQINWSRNNYASIGVNEDCLKITKGYVSKKNTYLNSIGRNDIYVFRKYNYRLKDYIKLLNLKKDDKINWRTKIKQYQTFVNGVWDTIESYDDIKIPKAYVEKLRIKRISNKPTGSITYYEYKPRQNWSRDWRTTAEPTSTKEFNHKKMVIYGTKDDRVELDNIWRLFPEMTNIEIIHLAPSNFKYLENKQYIHVKNWHKTKVFSRTITAYVIRQLLLEYKPLSQDCLDGWYKHKRYSQKLGSICKDFKDTLEELTIYSKKYYTDANSRDEFMKELLKVAQSEKLFDYSIYYKIEKLRAYFEKFEFVKYFKEDQDWEPLVINYIKKVNKNVRLDLECYQSPERHKPNA